MGERVRGLERASRPAGIVEVVIVAALAAGAWRLFMGWDWNTVAPNYSDPGPFSDTAANTRHGVVVGVVAAIAITWLALRGRPILGAIAVFAPIVLLSGSRMAVTRDNDGLWPIGLGILVFFGAMGCVVFAGAGTLLRRRIGRTQSPYP